MDTLISVMWTLFVWTLVGALAMMISPFLCVIYVLLLCITVYSWIIE